METSTPLHQKQHLRRRSLMNTSMLTSPLRRSTFDGQNPVVALNRTHEDDEVERSDRRNMVAMQRRLENITSSSSLLTEINQITDETQIKDHLRICTKLYAENKISAKNAWELQIIDVIQKITSGDNVNTLKIAGPSLDIGAKVYASRVDDVYACALKLASSISRNSNENQSRQEDDENVTVTETETQSKKKAITKRKRLNEDKRNTVDKEGKSLFTPHKQLESVLFSTKENIEVSYTDNLFTNKVRVSPANHQFMLMSKGKYWVTNTDQILEETEDEVDVELPVISDFTICHPFKDFEIGVWDPDEEEKQLINDFTSHDVVLDDNGLPIAEVDGSIHNIFEEDNEIPEDPVSDVEEDHEEFQEQIHGEVAHIIDAIPEENRIETDYGYNVLVKTATGKSIDRIWAGPSHWKVKFNKPSAARYSGSSVQQTAKYTRKVKVPQKIDFSHPPRVITDEKYVPKRAPRTVSFEKITLPVPELSYESFHKQTDEFLTKPGVRRPRLKGFGHNSEEYEVSAYNYENPNDSQYCSQHKTDDGNDVDEPMQNSFEEEGASAACQNFLSENLVNAPEMVATSHAPYAMQAKKMDMKKLKDAVWKILTQNLEGREIDPNGVNIKSVNFSQVYKDLPNFLSEEMVKELSCPLVFVALLDLCNENNLMLSQNSLSDFTIKKAVE